MDELIRELVGLQRDLAVQTCANTQIMAALLTTVSPPGLQRVKDNLEFQRASGELQGLADESCRLAVQIVSLVTDGDGVIDPRKLLRLIPGGKNEST